MIGIFSKESILLIFFYHSAFPSGGGSGRMTGMGMPEHILAQEGVWTKQ
jgi:hypothetical protein